MPRLALLAVLTAGCQAPSDLGSQVLQSPATTDRLEIDFNPRPPYLDKNAIALTFDDGPDDTYTARVLDILKDKGVKATFFINTINNANVDTDASAQALVRRMVAEGHDLGSHTVHHLDLAVQTEAKIEEEIAGVERTVQKLFGESAPPMTLLRAPYGRPYQSAAGSAAYQKVAAVVSRHGVHVGWNFDSNDWMFSGDSERVFRNVTGLIKTPGAGTYGVVLMHSINPQTVGALPRLIDYMRDNGFVFVGVENVVRARFGKSSAELLGPTTAGPAVDAGSVSPAADGAASLAPTRADAGGGTTDPTSSDAAVAPPPDPSSGSGAGSGAGPPPGAMPGSPPTAGGCSYGGTSHPFALTLCLALAAVLSRVLPSRRRGAGRVRREQPCRSSSRSPSS